MPWFVAAFPYCEGTEVSGLANGRMPPVPAVPPSGPRRSATRATASRGSAAPCRLFRRRSPPFRQRATASRGSATRARASPARAGCSATTYARAGAASRTRPTGSGDGATSPDRPAGAARGAAGASRGTTGASRGAAGASRMCRRCQSMLPPVPLAIPPVPPCTAAARCGGITVARRACGQCQHGDENAGEGLRLKSHVCVSSV